LGKQHYLAGKVQTLQAKYDPQTNQADVTFQVTTGAEIAIKIVGAHIWGRTQKKIIPIYEENAVDADLVREGQEDLTSYFQSKGFFDAEVTSRIEQQTDGTAVYYRIEKGKRASQSCGIPGKRAFLRERAGFAGCSDEGFVVVAFFFPRQVQLQIGTHQREAY